MTDLKFVDTNILVYARDGGCAGKHKVASDIIERLWLNRSGRLSTQVLNEYYATITRKLKETVDAEEAWEDVKLLLSWNPYPIDRDLLMAAREIERRYRTGWWDATIVAAAQAQRCTVLLSEDFQDGLVFGNLVVQNPFASAVQEPAATYRTETHTPLPRHRPRGRPAKSA